MAKSGADVILCQHSHCVGTYEEFEGCHIVYGQGNFHFAKEAYREKYEDWHEGLIIWYDADANRLEFIPLIAANGCIRLANAEEKSRILDGFASRSQSLQDGTWVDGWHAFCEKHREVYTRSVARAFAPEATERHNQMFAHYLDCEAHTDVWRELFKTYNLTDNQ
jgi:poly-gamma-glutamate synthesis protein (capsule biosynthesis protein)